MKLSDLAVVFVVAVLSAIPVGPAFAHDGWHGRAV